MQCAFNIFNSINPPRLALCMIKTFGLVCTHFSRAERSGDISEMRILTMTRHVSSVSALYLMTFYSEAHCDSHVLDNDNILNGAARHDAQKSKAR